MGAPAGAVRLFIHNSRITDPESGIAFGRPRPPMRQAASRLLIILACVVSTQCGGGSDATNTQPSSVTSSTPAGDGSTDGSGGSSGGATDTVRAVTPMTDSVFDDNDWDEVVETYGATGSGSAGHLSFNGQADAGY